MKLITLATLAAFAIVSAAPAMAADTVKTSNKTRVSDDLNRQQLTQYNQFMTTRPATVDAYSAGQPQVGYVEGDAEGAPTEVLVVGPAHDAAETTREPQTSPPSSGQPAIDEPYIAVQPAQ